MKISPVPENLLECLLYAAGVVPVPLVDTFQAILRARSIMAGTALGIFETLAGQPLAAEAIAQRIGGDLRATEKLLNALVGARYLRFGNGEYRLARVARRWLLKNSPRSLHDNMLHRYLEWKAAEHFEEFVRTGRPLDIHQNLSPAEWTTYQKGMRSLASLSADEVARRLKIPAGARDMLDLGGAHGWYAVALCRRHPALRATIVDLPDAVSASEPILAREQMADRITYRADNVLTADLGEGRWDLIFMSQLLHHFSAEQNRSLMARVARALRPGGMTAVLEVIRPGSPNAAGQTGALLDLFFAAVSASGSWSLEELTTWQQQADLKPRKPLGLYTIPGGCLQTAVKGGLPQGHD